MYLSIVVTMCLIFVVHDWGGELVKRFHESQRGMNNVHEVIGVNDVSQAKVVLQIFKECP